MSKYIFRSYPHNPRVYKSIIAAKIGGVQGIEYPDGFKIGVDNKTPEFDKKSPLGKVPLLETPDGPIWESDAMLRYMIRVGNKADQLLGKTPYEQSEVDRWVDVFNFYMGNHSYSLVYPFHGYSTYSQEKFDHARNEMGKAWGWVEHELNARGKRYLLYDYLTMADIVMGTGLVSFCKTALDKEWRSKFPKTENYLKALWALEEFKSVQGEVVPLEKFEPPKAA